MHELKHKTTEFDLQELCFYFDSQAKDRFDQGELGKKSSLVLALRQKLLAMPSQEFDSTIKTIEKLVAAASQKSDDQDQARRKGARELYEKATEEIRKN